MPNVVIATVQVDVVNYLNEHRAHYADNLVKLVKNNLGVDMCNLFSG